MSTRFTERQAAALIAKAEAAAAEAFEAARPTPMMVGTPRDMMGSLMGGDGGGFDTDQPIYRIEGGVCGFAWVNLRDGRTSFARQAKKLAGARKSYYGGLDIRPQAMGFSQSYERKMAACQAYAEILREGGVKGAFADGRLD